MPRFLQEVCGNRGSDFAHCVVPLDVPGQHLQLPLSLILGFLLFLGGANISSDFTRELRNLSHEIPETIHSIEKAIDFDIAEKLWLH